MFTYVDPDTGARYGIMFQHGPEGVRKKPRMVTSAAMVAEDYRGGFPSVLDGHAQDLVFGWGAITCSRHDQFVKETGRKGALRALLANLHLPKRERLLIWKAYFESTGKHERAASIGA